LTFTKSTRKKYDNKVKGAIATGKAIWDFGFRIVSDFEIRISSFPQEFSC